MCFSAGASFGASVVLGAVGVATLTKVKAPEQYPFAVIPLLFAGQQFSEGLLWVGLANPEHASLVHYPVYAFLIFAQVIWPVWVPMAILLLEKNRLRRRILLVFTGMGMSISVYLLYCLIVYDVSAEIRSGHIHYSLNFPSTLAWFRGMLYFIPTVVSLFVSGVKRMFILALGVLGSFVVTQIYFDESLISVWCFFAGLLSAIIFWIASAFPRRKVSLHSSTQAAQ